MFGSGAKSGAKKKAPPAGVQTTFLELTNDPFPANFFAALNQGNDDEALRFMTAEALPDGSTPSPRAEEHVLSGEWDLKTRVPLVYLDASSCGGRVGDSGDRACGKPRGACTAQAHLKS